MNRRPRRGFTLIEAAVAVALAAIVVTLSRAILNAVGDGATRISSAAAKADSDQGTQRMLRSLLTSAHSTGRDSIAFFGAPTGAYLSARCPTSGGWSQPCKVTLAVGDSGRAIVCQLDGRRQQILVRSGEQGASLAYLASVSGELTWLANWPASRLAPVALELVADGDTLVIPIGG